MMTVLHGIFGTFVVLVVAPAALFALPYRLPKLFPHKFGMFSAREKQ